MPTTVDTVTANNAATALRVWLMRSGGLSGRLAPFVTPDGQLAVVSASRGRCVLDLHVVNTSVTPKERVAQVSPVAQSDWLGTHY